MTTSMNDNTHSLLNKLRVIGQIKEGQKLSTNGNNLYIYTDGWMNWFLRKWSHDSKDEGVRTLRDLYRGLEQSTESLIVDTKSQNEIKKSRAVYFIINIAVELKNSIRGLENLSKTYVGYQTTVAELEGIVKDLAVILHQTLLDAIPKDKLPKELKESIMYRGACVLKGAEEDVVVNVNDEEEETV